ncbi:CHASE2 domain-containing protein [Billgrantia montanilacus]|uniref:Adenylate/guanylate cyclase domain-containing protein n=1 Tax=Billgrantia montanilacus TaxID=2282305 RepID=A0A368U211_9GAMM|nr:adenylate/guanylate cyclase domain-containing protein [Halomonas montanilacus]RCV90861.1 adenylate/guanylate cyclase domain-containing protein [Halomonas montanilacus]
MASKAPIHTRKRYWHWLQYAGGLLIVMLLLVEKTGLLPFPLLERLEWQAYDMKVRSTLSEQADPSLAIVDIDERSLYEVGQWPWPRATLADLVDTLFTEYEAGLLGIDVVFAEPETSLWQQHWEELFRDYPALGELPPPVDGDEQLSNALAAHPVVLGYYFQASRQPNDPPSVGQLPRPAFVEASDPLPFPAPERYTANLPILQQNAMSAGFFDNPRVDDDGVFRRVPILQRWEGELYPNLPLAMLLTLLGEPPITPVLGEGAGVTQMEALDVGGFEIPVDGRGAALVPWYGPRGHFDYIPAVDVLEGRLEPGALAGKTLILGASAPGLMDLRSTPVGGVYPGPEINLSLLAGMLHQSIHAQPPWVLGFELVSLAALGILMVLLYPHLNALLLVAISSVLLATAIGGNLWAWYQGLALPIAGLLVLLVAQMIWHLAMNFLRETQQKRWVAERFGQYIPPQLVEDMVDSGESFGLEGEERELTVLFSDVRGFTAFSETIAPAELTEVMNRLLTPLTGAIHQHRGTIDKYMGDAIMAFWGAPLRDAQHAEHALEGAFAMLDALDAVNREFIAEGKPALAMGVGLNTGPMSVGNMGSSFRMAYTVMGDNVNLGSRLEGLTKAYGVSVIVSETTAERVPNWCFRRLDKVRVKGRSAPLWILEPLGRREALSESRRGWLATYEQALDLYHAADFTAAERAFKVLANQQDAPTQMYLERIEKFKVEPPPSDWDGVWTHMEK